MITLVDQQFDPGALLTAFCAGRTESGAVASFVGIARADEGATATLEVGPADAEALALAKSEGELSLVLRSYADTAGPSGRVQAPRQSAAVRIFRGGAPEVVVVQ